MTKDVTVEELQEHLTENLNEVQHGTTLRVFWRGKAVAQVTAVDDLTARPPLRSMAEVVLPPPLRTQRDILEYLEDERGDR